MDNLRMKIRGFGITLTLAIVLLTGYCLRVQNGNWDDGYHQHPDERFMTMVASAIRFPTDISTYFNTDKSPTNPYNNNFNSYVYGTVPLFLTRLIGEWKNQTDYDHIYIIGRHLSAIMDSLTILLVFLIAIRFLRSPFALLAATFYALAVMPIQQAHFFTVDSTAVTMITLAFYFCVRLATDGSLIRNTVGASIAFGLALASRINILTFSPLIPLALFLATTKQRPLRRTLSICSLTILTAFTTLALFRVFQPYAFDGLFHFSSQWLKDLNNVIQISNGSHDVPFTRQWAGRIPWLFPWINITRWGLGWTLGITCWIGFLGAGSILVSRIYRSEKLRAPAQPALLLCTIWTLIVFGYHGQVFLKTMRYFLPVYPALILCGAWVLQAAFTALAKRFKRYPAHITAHLPWMIVLITTLGWSIAFSAIYRHPHTRVTASEWMLNTFPKGSTVAVEHWDDSLPLHLRGHDLSVTFESLPLYDNDNPRKLDKLIVQLSRSDFIELASNRLYDSIPRIPRRYPMTIRYYEALFDGSLGFEKVADFTSYPTLFGLSFPDQDAEEAFSVYDHPRVQVFAKTSSWNPEKARKTLSEGINWSTIQNTSALNSSERTTLPVLSELAQATHSENGTWSINTDRENGFFDRHGFSNRYPILCWIIMIDLIALAAFPFCFLLFSKLPDRGMMASKVAGTVILTYLIWLTGRLGVFPITPVNVRLTLLSFGLASLLLFFKHRRTIFVHLRQRIGLLIIQEALFWIIFSIFLVIRMGNPDLWHPYFGGEKPMDFAFLNATVRSVSFPPYNPWLTGEYLNYYYMGFVLASVWIKLTGILPAIAYNLIIPTLAAMTGMGAFCIAGSLIWGFTSPARRTRKYILCGTIAIVLTIFSGNLYQWLLLLKDSVPNWDWYWAASRAIKTLPGEVPPITEFPFFTFLYGDLHAHMIAMPVFLLTILCGVQLTKSRPTMALTFMLSLLTGIIFTINAWDYPTLLLITACSLCLSLSKYPLPKCIILSGLLSLLIVILGRIMLLPFHQDFCSGYTNFKLWDGARSTWRDLLIVHGIFILPIISALIFSCRKPTLKAPDYLLWLAFIATSTALITAVEFIVLDGDIARMNTVFKFYLHVWFLLSISAATAVGILLNQKKHRITISTSLLLFALIGLAGLLYPFTATPARWRDHFVPDQKFTLNGQAFMADATYHWEKHSYPLRDDYEAMQWLFDNVTGTPVIAEAQLPEYRWGSRYSIHTGLPTILGWSWHQRQQHAGLPHGYIQKRADDITNLYSTTSPELARRIARKYKVQYIIIGPAEKATYSFKGIEKFKDADTSYWTPVYTNTAVTILKMANEE